ncbi:MAG: hypothetical protein JXA42_24675 [Anaerolineales bacterium]|nr:hypothetical protein [Anaerolineales bacterium]
MPSKEIGIPSFVEYELQVGISKSGSLKRKEQLDALISAVQVLPFGYDEATIAARIRVDLEKKASQLDNTTS